MQNNLTKKLFDNQAIVIVQPIADYRHCLYQSELSLIQNVSEKRMQEFSTGRDCAHRALHQLGYEICPILKGPQREPLWPEQIVGSISHCHDLAGAVVADKRHLHSVGLDIEKIKPLNPNISRHICTQDEKNWLIHQPPGNQNLALLLIFSIKEAIFKCIYQATGQSLRFHDCNLLPSFSEERVAINICATKYISANAELRGFFHINESHIYSSVIWIYTPYP